MTQFVKDLIGQMLEFLEKGSLPDKDRVKRWEVDQGQEWQDFFLPAFEDSCVKRAILEDTAFFNTMRDVKTKVKSTVMLRNYTIH